MRYGLLKNQLIQYMHKTWRDKILVTNMLFCIVQKREFAGLTEDSLRHWRRR